MNEPFLPLPIPTPPTDGFGALLIRAWRWFVEATAPPAGHPRAVDRRPASEPRLAPGRAPTGCARARRRAVSFPTLPTLER